MDDVTQHMADLTQRLGQGMAQVAEQGRSFQEQVIGMMVRGVDPRPPPPPPARVVRNGSGADPRPPPPPPPAAVQAVRQAIAAIPEAVDEAPQAGAKRKAEASEGKARATTPAPLDRLKVRESVKEKEKREAQERAAERPRAASVAASKAAKKALVAAKEAEADKKEREAVAKLDTPLGRLDNDNSKPRNEEKRKTRNDRSAQEAQERATAARKAADEAASKAAKQALLDKKRASPPRAVPIRITLKKSADISPELRKNFQEGFASALQSISSKAAVKPEDLRLIMGEVLARVGGGSPNTAAAAEIDASIKRTLTRAVAGRVEKADQAEVRKFLKIGLKKADEDEAFKQRMTQASARERDRLRGADRQGSASSKAVIQKLSKKNSTARPFRTVVA